MDGKIEQGYPVHLANTAAIQQYSALDMFEPVALSIAGRFCKHLILRLKRTSVPDQYSK